MYLIRSKGPENRIRDGESGEMKTVTSREWVVFGALPRGMTVAGSPTSEVREVLCDADLESAIQENRRMADEDGRRYDAPSKMQAGPPVPVPMSAEVTPSDPPKPRRGRPRSA